MPKHGEFMWNEICTTDPEATKAFFTALIGWGTQPMAMPQGGTYTIWTVDDKPVGGLFPMDEEKAQHMPAGWMAYICVDDVDDCVDRVGGLGGRVLAGPFEVEGIGRIAMIADPTGSPVSIMTPAPELETDD
jgi:predicted enzyme related to lactoylglutathione lyase